MARAVLVEERAAFHAALLKSVLSIDNKGVPSNADKDNQLSVRIAHGIATKLKSEVAGSRLAGQTSGSQFEDACAAFVKSTFSNLPHLRPRTFDVFKIRSRDRLAIAKYDQYAHLIELDHVSRGNPALRAALGSDYTITPDIVIERQLESDEVINRPRKVVDPSVARLASLRRDNGGAPLLHASISCKWTIRSDRVQSSRSEALNLIRNRKGRLPHIVVITAEPTPSRLAAIALGTGDIDCVYHFALQELQQTLQELQLEDALDMLAVMVEGKRLKDIADLPLDLAV